MISMYTFTSKNHLLTSPLLNSVKFVVQSSSDKENQHLGTPSLIGSLCGRDHATVFQHRNPNNSFGVCCVCFQSQLYEPIAFLNHQGLGVKDFEQAEMPDEQEHLR